MKSPHSVEKVLLDQKLDKLEDEKILNFLVKNEELIDDKKYAKKIKSLKKLKDDRLLDNESNENFVHFFSNIIVFTFDYHFHMFSLQGIFNRKKS